MKILRARKAMVTGAASGIGRCIALALARESVDLCLIDIDEANLQMTAQAAKGHGVEVVARVCDLSQSSATKNAVDFLLSTWDRLNILVNCAGICHYGATHAMSDEQWNRIIAVNLLAPIQLTRALLPILAAQDEAHVLNVCSIHGLVSSARIAAYQTSKFGLVGFSAALHAEYARPGFGVTALCPGIVRTPLIDKLKLDWANGGVSIPAWLGTSPEVVAAKALTAIRSNKGLVVITAYARALWWLARLSPGLAQWLARKGLF
ncbi:MAG: SDR family NAD(P)-dependent oxidoreductase [Pseudolabrys sp.]